MVAAEVAWYDVQAGAGTGREQRKRVGGGGGSILDVFVGVGRSVCAGEVWRRKRDINFYIHLITAGTSSTHKSISTTIHNALPNHDVPARVLIFTSDSRKPRPAHWIKQAPLDPPQHPFLHPAQNPCDHWLQSPRVPRVTMMMTENICLRPRLQYPCVSEANRRSGSPWEKLVVWSA